METYREHHLIALGLATYQKYLMVRDSPGGRDSTASVRLSLLKTFCGDCFLMELMNPQSEEYAPESPEGISSAFGF